MPNNQNNSREGKTQQEIEGNKRVLLGFKIIFGVFTFAWICNEIGIFDVDVTSFRFAYIICTILTLVPAVFQAKLPLGHEKLKFFLMADICIVCGIAVTVLTSYAYFLFVLPFFLTLNYKRLNLLWYTYVVNFITMTASSIAGFYVGMADLNIFLQGRHTRNWYMNHYMNDHIIMDINMHPVLSIISFLVMPNAILMLLFVLLSKSSFEGFAEDTKRIDDLTVSKDTDALTGLYNKTKYKEMISDYYAHLQSVGAIFWDLNDLKKTNDKLGHEAGDKLISNFASCIKFNRSTDKRIRTYRIGGDEFVILVDFPADGELENIVKISRERIENINKQYGMRMSSAVGYAVGKGSQTEEVIKEADKLMYEDKIRSKKQRVD